MKHRVDAELLRDVERFRLRFSCEQCVYHDPARSLCSEGYPDGEHRARHMQVGEDLSFCKLFELL
jgi:hypothetical protein